MNMYRILSYALLFWAFISTLGVIGTVAAGAFGLTIPGVQFDESRPGAPGYAGPVGYAIFTLVTGVFIAALLQGAKTVRGLETIRENWGQSTRDLRRLAMLLLAAILAQFIGGSVNNSIAASREAGGFILSPVLDLTQLSFALIALIIFLAARALDLANAEIEENKTFL